MKLFSRAFFILAFAGTGFFTKAYSIENLDIISLLNGNTALETVAKQLAEDPYPVHTLFHVWKETLALSDDSLTPPSLLEVIEQGRCPKNAFIPLFLELCQKVGIQVRTINGQPAAFDFGIDDKWTYLDLESGCQIYGWDNETAVSSEEIMDDPFLFLRNQSSDFNPWEKLARFALSGSPTPVECNNVHFNPHAPSSSRAENTLFLTGQALFSASFPQFTVENRQNASVEAIHWQIAKDPSFKALCPNFDRIESHKEQIVLSALDDSFLNAQTDYFIRIRDCVEGKWSEWSTPLLFRVKKPESVTLIEFEKKAEASYELNWERETDNDPSIDYLVFGSNSFDFIPSIYGQPQVNRICKNGIESEEAENLVAVTKEARLLVDGSFAYYRIIAMQNGQLSVPSPLIRVYDEDLVQPRNVLQMAEEGNEQVAKRVLFSVTYPWTQVSYPVISHVSDPFENSLISLYARMRASVFPLTVIRAYDPCPRLSPEIWDSLIPYFLPENHPAKSKLDRMFSATRIILTPETFREAGFKRHRQGRFSRIMASPHPDLPRYFFKGFPDSELGVKADWYKLRGRIEGAKAVRNWIAENKLESIFSVPNKWLYPLPENPAPPKSSKYLRKNFILVADNMRILDHEKNEKAYRTRMNKKLLDQLYRLLDDVGLYDSVYAFNMPFCKDGRIAIIDTEYYYRWPVPYHKLTKYFSKEMKQYWESLIEHGGPKGHVRAPRN